jgi:hypothetical protein
MTNNGTRANSARVYEYILAGRTPGVPFTQADIRMAEVIAEQHPNTVQGMHLHHLYIEVAARAYHDAGIHHYIDIGAGLPTIGALHEFVEDGDAILYVDQDAEAVAFGQQEAKLEMIEQILAEAEQLFGDNRLVGVNLISIAHFVDDEQLSRALGVLYDWAAPGSLVAVTSTPGERTQGFQKASDEYKKSTGLSVYLRTPEEMVEVFRPWQPFVPPSGVEDQVEQMLGTTVAQNEYRGLLGYGGIFLKQ